MKPLQPVVISGFEVLPLVEGGKGVSISNGESAGAWAAAGGVGTFSATNADTYDSQGRPIFQDYLGKNRRERFEELVAYAIHGGIVQAQRAHEVSGGRGPIHMNILWEAGGTERVMHGILEGARGLVHGVTCGAGMPYKVAEIASHYGVYYYPIVSSARAFRALWKRAYHKYAEWLGGVVYEDPWLAGGHNGLSNVEDPEAPQDPYPRVVELRATMREFGLDATPVFMAGGVWYLREWEHWLDNPDIGPLAFQIGTRAILTRESPVSEAWKKRLLNLKKGEVFLNRFSPTGFYSSAVNNSFIQELRGRSERQVAFTREPLGEHTEALSVGARGRLFYLTAADKVRAEGWIAEGYVTPMQTPDSTLVFVTPGKAEQIRADQSGCMGCLSACRFSNWAQNEIGSTGKLADPRSYCIQKTLQDVAHGGDTDSNLMFSGHNGYRFADDPFYGNGFIPTVGELVERMASGD
ncbi:NAD(P)H-dependent flavin oxidoreductase [Shumkonia mesophila]|uniref:NAD(P)H-dependent flavin oxidoreductase n=1 Tax=Shumkonia mesophila TaxID=2838854 RepID=UPI0029340F9B|nr:nitronate monooxygenase [Shumkonia mesophila]